MWVYAILLGVSVIFQRGTQYLAVLQAEGLGFLASRSFFERLIAKRPSFFIDQNPAEIQAAQSQGTQAITMLVKVAFIAVRELNPVEHIGTCETRSALRIRSGRSF
jgi:hypothetical protein